MRRSSVAAASLTVLEKWKCASTNFCATDPLVTDDGTHVPPMTKERR
jgi:hypothetical protein